MAADAPFVPQERAALRTASARPAEGRRWGWDTLSDSGSEGSDGPAADEELGFAAGSARTLTAVQLALVGFFIVSGGPQGMEPAVKAAGPGPALLGILLFPLVWALPQCLVIAEMSTMNPRNGSYIIWTARAFGPFGAWMNGLISVSVNCFDLALYPLLITSYLEDVLDLHAPLARWSFILALTALAIALNLAGMDAVGRASGVLFALLFVPYVVELGAASFQGRLDPAVWFQGREGGIDWRLLVNILFWQYSGWDALGSSAGEVRDPRRTYPRAAVGAVALTAFAYAVPVAVGVCLSRDWDAWDEGHFVDAAAVIWPWLGHWLAVSAAISAFGVFNATLSSYSRTMWRVARYRMLPQTLGMSLKTRAAPPVAAIVLHAALAVALCNFSFTTVLAADNFLSGASLVFEKAAFLRTKWVEPDAHRPYEVPGGRAGAVLACVMPTGIIVFMWCLATWETWLLSGGIILASAGLYRVWLAGHLRRLAPSWGPPDAAFRDADEYEG